MKLLTLKETIKKIGDWFKRLWRNITTTTLLSKIVLMFRTIWKGLMDFDVFKMTGFFVAIMLSIYLIWWKALILGFFGYLIYQRLEYTLFKIFGKSTK